MAIWWHAPGHCVRGRTSHPIPQARAISPAENICARWLARGRHRRRGDDADASWQGDVVVGDDATAARAHASTARRQQERAHRPAAQAPSRRLHAGDARSRGPPSHVWTRLQRRLSSPRRTRRDVCSFFVSMASGNGAVPQRRHATHAQAAELVGRVAPHASPAYVARREKDAIWLRCERVACCAC